MGLRGFEINYKRMDSGLRVVPMVALSAILNNKGIVSAKSKTMTALFGFKEFFFTLKNELVWQ